MYQNVLKRVTRRKVERQNIIPKFEKMTVSIMIGERVRQKEYSGIIDRIQVKEIFCNWQYIRVLQSNFIASKEKF